MSDERAGVLEGAIAPVLNTHLFGHREQEDFFARSYRSGKGHHAVLIEGPEGIGKATLAFRFANHILRYPEPSLAPDTIADPDPAHPVSRQLASGASHNLLHLSRPVDEKTGRVKSAITVDEVRKAGHFFAQTSGTGNWRIVIIDPADDLNRNAANAILKILEEPPKRAMFLVLSHAPGKLLPTIRSRCLPLRLHELSPTAMDQALGGLGLTIPADRRDQVLALAKGSVARALKLVNYGGAEILEAFEAMLGASGPTQRKMMFKIADALSAKDSDVAHGFFIEHLGDHLAETARRLALSGDLTAADHYARLTSTIGEQLTVAAAYNLDRKQTILDVLTAVTR
ncbi:DNA polymerase III subunit delta' [Rhizobium sp. AAP43]|uniref:DNA polymerase III subunit delta' n=1 Tax=Rhizobium sp. AAP43 TaxID=1523420 RepID=UPI0006B8B11C|nr:DNA polymerase III subunit delta' [Rhizobium sp. AAP43]KPF43736.1 DNA polymerase III subunit delta' [Rhizobium sp. AAP43]